LRSLRLALVAIFLVLTPIVASSNLYNSEPKGVSVTLKSDWTGHPLLAQAGELVAAESVEKYWSLIDAIVGDGVPSREVDQMTWLQKRKEIIDLDQEGLFSLSLAFHSSAPRCQLFQQHATNILNSFLNSTKPTEAHKTMKWFGLVPAASAPFDRPLFTIQDVQQALDTTIEGYGEQNKAAFFDKSKFSSLVLPFDHRRTPTAATKRQVILFADYAAREFAEVHKHALQNWLGEHVPASSTTDSATSPTHLGDVEYILRPFSPSGYWHGSDSDSPLGGSLQGYGVELAFKNVEYRVLDQQSLQMPGMQGLDDESSVLASEILNTDGEPHENIKNVILARQPESQDKLESIVRDWWKIAESSEDGASAKPLYELTSEALETVAVKAAQVVYDSEEPFKALRDISQNFPSVAHLLTEVDLRVETIEDVQKFATSMDAAGDVMVLNGRSIPLDTLDFFTLQKHIQDEVSKYQVLKRVGQYAAASLPGSEQLTFSHTEISDYLAASLTIDMVPKIDLLWDGVVTVLNDLETHPNYQRYPKRVRELLKPSWPGQLMPIGKNFFTLVLVIDPEAGSEGIRLLDQLTRIVIQNNIPLRLAFHVLTSNPSNREEGWVKACSKSSAQADTCDLNWLWSKLLQASHGSLPDFINFVSNAAQNPTNIAHIKDAWEMSGIAQTIEDAISSNADKVFTQYMHLSAAGFVKSESTNNNLMLFNGRLLELDPENPLGALGQQLQASKQQFQQDVYHGKIDDSTDLYQYALGAESEIFPGYNAQIFATKNAVFFDLASVDFAFHALPSVQSQYAERFLKSITHLVIGDVKAAIHRKVLANYFEALQEETNALGAARLMVLPISNDKNDPSFLALEYLINELARVNSQPEKRNGLTSLILTVLASEQTSILDSLCENGGNAHCEAAKQYITSSDAGLLGKMTKLSNQILATASLSPTTAADKTTIVTNGRIIVLNSKVADMWEPTSWNMLTRFESTTRTSVVETIFNNQASSHIEKNTAEGIWEHILEDETLDSSARDATLAKKKLLASIRSDVIMKIVSYMSSFPSTPKSAFVAPLDHGKLVRSKKTSIGEDPMITGFLYLDPLSSRAQVVSSLMSLFMEVVPMDVRLVLLPKMGLSENPLKKYYRYVATPALRFDSVTGRVKEEGAHFDYLPKERIMTLNLIANSQWMVESVEAPSDLDNLLLHQVTSRRMKAIYQLQSILVEGSCADMSAGGQPPRGLKLILGDATAPHLVDTLVMSNLGYFQLKANPGIWYLSLADGRSSQIYDIQSSQHSNSITPHATVFLSEFTSSKVPMRVAKKAGLEKETLEEEEIEVEQKNMWSFFGSSGTGKSVATVNVFSVASGHLYERFLRIMMLSVKRNTQSPVKFWIIKNFLSPMFKKSVEAMGQEFGFEVELVQYQWPDWLRGQSEKQRKIWGYKILFLDVLFPLSLKKVIFIDADQVVRTDLQELMDYDLQGKPYGFTPFCEGESLKRSETSGFRFWDSGFWKDHLHGRPYHISALFVVDLERLRKFGFADQLRATYDQLSRDPNSLANLDQDLPNYLQHYVPIHSLPAEWLWCETWCSDESKSRAKTIDLCNNPLTKTPKLDNALRIIPEWPELDKVTSDWYKSFQDAYHDQHVHHHTHIQQTSKTEQNQKDEL